MVVPIPDGQCGGPWKYLIYSTLSVDPEAAQDAVDHHNAIDAAMNRRHYLLSDCAIVPHPYPYCSAGVCVARN